MEYGSAMERICSECHAVVAVEVKLCPGCGGGLVERVSLPDQSLSGPYAEVDHRGIVLPRRHALGGVITPQ
jgi:hypothetical protein